MSSAPTIYRLEEILDPTSPVLFEVVQAGIVHFRVHGNRGSSRRVITDAQGKVLLALKQAAWTTSGKELLFSPGFSQRLGAVKPAAIGSLDAQVLLAQPEQRKVSLHMRGNEESTKAALTSETDGALVAEVAQTQYAATKITPARRDAFAVRLQPGQDLLPVLATVVALETSFKMQYNPTLGVNGYSPLGFGAGAYRRRPVTAHRSQALPVAKAC